MPVPGEMLRAIREARDRQLTRLNADYPQAANRLTSAYNGAVSSIESALSSWQDELSPGYPDIVTEADRAATERLLAAIQRDLDALNGNIDTVLRDMQASGVTEGYIGGLQALNAGGVGVGFNQTVLDTILAGINYVDDPAMQARIAQLAGYHAQQIRDLILSGIANGSSPRLIAQLIHQYFVNSKYPLTDALRWARTTQIYSYRRGTQAIYRRSGVTEWIWSANLGSPRTCLACIAMHGTVHPVEQVLNDHFNGRCAMVPVTPTWGSLGFTGGGEPRYQTGIDWLREQDDDVIRGYMGPQLFDAYQRGMFRLDPGVIVGTYSHPVFGDMRVLKPNWQILASNIFG